MGEGEFAKHGDFVYFVSDDYLCEYDTASKKLLRLPMGKVIGFPVNLFLSSESVLFTNCSNLSYITKNGKKQKVYPD